MTPADRLPPGWLVRAAVISAALAVVVTSACGSATKPTAQSVTTVSTTSTTSPQTSEQTAFDDVTNLVQKDNDLLTNTKLVNSYQDWVAGQPFVADCQAAEHELDQVHWTTQTLASESQLYSDLQTLGTLFSTPWNNQPYTFGPSYNTAINKTVTDLTALKAAIEQAA